MTVVPEEPYVDARVLAKRMGVSVSTIKRWVREGLPSETWGMKRTRRFRVSECMAWRREHGDQADDRGNGPRSRKVKIRNRTTRQ
jgi:hypothetical protein